MEYDTAALRQRLAGLADEKYKSFNDSLIPGGRMSFGVRKPVLDKLAHEILAGDWQGFLEACPGEYHEERMLMAMVTAGLKCGPEEKLERVKAFVPMIDNWAICDCFCAKLKDAKRYQAEYYDILPPYIESGDEYKMRFAAVMLLDHYVNDEYIDRVLDVYRGMRHDGYYLRMAVAWGISICYINYPEKTLELIKEGSLDTFTHNKAIQKCRESFRVSAGDKQMLAGLKK